jgi:hypothetical protein
MPSVIGIIGELHYVTHQTTSQPSNQSQSQLPE